MERQKGTNAITRRLGTPAKFKAAQDQKTRRIVGAPIQEGHQMPTPLQENQSTFLININRSNRVAHAALFRCDRTTIYFYLSATEGAVTLTLGIDLLGK